METDEKQPIESGGGTTREETAKKSDTARRIGMGIFLLGIIFSIFFLYTVFIPRSFSGKEAIAFQIERGEGTQSIGMRLKDAGVIQSAFSFNLYARMWGISRLIKFGNYNVRSDISVHELLKVFSVNGSPDEVVVTILEGWTVKDIARHLENKELFPISEFLREIDADFTEEFSFLKNIPRVKGSRIDVERYYLQGYLFPDTYRVFRDASPVSIIKKMLENFDKKLTENMRTEIIIQRKTIGEIITMASLLEREVRGQEDKAIVSGILWKRLQLKMPLQVDATIVFVKTSGFGSLDGNQKIYFDDLKLKSAYNTYLNPGLPPGPISNPGVESIEAAIYPKSTPFLYYLSAPPDGKTIFSKTLDEHNRNKAKYLK
ncbi:MAG: endolytic transglycosylase MltG [Patescibacteria group bacterium]